MKILIGDEWEGNFLDYYTLKKSVRINVKKWINVERIKNQYIDYDKSNWRKVVNYLKKDGIKAVVRKVYSRYKEKYRNKKWASIGAVCIIDTRLVDRLNRGDEVVFFAYNHPRCLDRVVLDRRFVLKYSFSEISRQSLGYVEKDNAPPLPDNLLHYRGWSPESGWKVDELSVRGALDEVAPRIEQAPADRSLNVDPSRPTKERSKHEENYNTQLRGSLFGLGHYAKSVIIPNLPPEIRIENIHEVDPLQLGKKGNWSRTTDTSKHFRPEESPDISFIAGYHHTHADLAIDALSQKSWAVVEKPLCTTHEQLNDINKTLKKRCKLFVGFHKRYSKINKWIRQDLGTDENEAINYYCIVYEIPLPKLHWYNWPKSKSRVVSNGCHWLDHFMYLNNYQKVRRNRVRIGSNGDMIVTVELENDALFSMTLTDSGSDRLGVREHVELRAGDRTVSVVDNSEYEAEGGERVLRRENVKRRASYHRMYQEIGRKIVDGEPGDSLDTLRSTKLMLDLEEDAQREV